MVVVAIIVLAAGLMTPTITDFFKNRQLEGIRGTIGSAFNRARMAAVDHGKSMSLVFFREGARVFDESTKSFDPDDHFNPETSPFADEAVWYVLGFLRKKASPRFPSTATGRNRSGSCARLPSRARKREITAPRLSTSPGCRS
jgi:hypothetical protein